MGQNVSATELELIDRRFVSGVAQSGRATLEFEVANK